MRLGYACINTQMPITFKTCRIATVEKKGLEYIKELSLHNLELTLEILKWNVKHNIYFYRLSSEVIPFSSHPINSWKWQNDKDIKEITNKIKEYKTEHNIRLSSHPGQFNVLNSPNEKVVKNTVIELENTAIFLNMMDGDDMILHIGGIYGDKETATKRFIQNYKNLLSNNVKRKLRIENDDKSFNISDVVAISKETGNPICFDIHHHNCLNNGEQAKDFIKDIVDSWEGFGIPKVHISSGKTHKQDRSHHDYISEEDFIALKKLFVDIDIDIMFEAKMKEQAVLKIYNISQ